MKPTLSVGTFISYLGVNAVVIEDGSTEFLVLCDGDYEKWSWELDGHTCEIVAYPSCNNPEEYRSQCLSRMVDDNKALQADYQRLQAECGKLRTLLEQASEFVFAPDRDCKCQECVDATSLLCAIESAITGGQPWQPTGV